MQSARHRLRIGNRGGRHLASGGRNAIPDDRCRGPVREVTYRRTREVRSGERSSEWQDFGPTTFAQIDGQGNCKLEKATQTREGDFPIFG